MKRGSAVLRISVSLAAWTASILLAAQMFNLLPDPALDEFERRKDLSELICLQCAQVLPREGATAAKGLLDAMRRRTADLRSASVESADGHVLLQSSDPRENQSASETISVPMFRGKARWGTVKIAFRGPAGHGGRIAMLASPLARLLCFVTILGFIGFRFYLRRALKHLDPSSVIPERVKLMLDIMAEGVLILDSDEQIVMANASFLKLLGQPLSEVLGRRASGLGWVLAPKAASDSAPLYPWLETMADRTVRTSRHFRLDDSNGNSRSLILNCAPVIGGDGAARGSLVTVDDITPVEKKNAELEASRAKIEQQNRELLVFATTDPLTGCVNRRSMHASMESEWLSAHRYHFPMACVMLDIDHFKSINDGHGHAVGDEVLKSIGATIREVGRASDVICRYGGEEFLILLPHTDAASAELTAERLRKLIAARPCSGVSITSSFGISTTEMGATSAEEMIKQADAALYHSKHTGRNRVSRWDAMQNPLIHDRPQPAPCEHSASYSIAG